MRSRIGAACVLFQLVAVVAYGATYVVPTDREMVRRAQAIVIGEALASYTQLNDKGGVETVTPFSVSEVLKGRIADDTINIYEPGGRYGDHITSIPGVPRFNEGEKLLLFLSRGGAARWGVTVLALGRFSFATDRTGRSVVVRAEGDVVGWEPNGEPHKEMRRSADAFIAFIRAEASGGVGKNDYVVPFEPLPVDPTTGRKIPARTLVTYTPVSYSTDVGGGQGSRWITFPTAVTFKTAYGGSAGATAVTTAIANWNTAAGAQVNYSNGGTDNCSAGCTGLGAVSDGVNDVLFEQDLHAKYNAGTFSCSGSSYGGLLGLGGISNTSGSNSFASATWYTTSEADVEMNTNVLACVGVGPGFTAAYLAMAVTHELGHTLGFRHSDYNRTDTGACVPGSYECTSSAVMNHFVPNVAGLQTYDLNAVAAVYPPGSAPPTPTGVIATAASATSVGVSWNTSTGATSYQVYRQAVRNGAYTAACTATAPATSCTDSGASASTAYLYSVVALNGSTPSGYSAYDLATTMVYTDSTLATGASGTTIQAVHITELRTAVNAVRTVAGAAAATWTNPVAAGSTISAADVTDLRTNLDAAMTTLGLTTGGYTDTSLSGVAVKAVHFTQLRNRMN